MVKIKQTYYQEIDEEKSSSEENQYYVEESESESEEIVEMKPKAKMAAKEKPKKRTVGNGSYAENNQTELTDDLLRNMIREFANTGKSKQSKKGRKYLLSDDDYLKIAKYMQKIQY